MNARISYGIIGLLLCMTACTNETGDSVTDSEKMSIRLGYTIDEGLGVTTRAATGAGRTFGTGQKVNIYIWDVTDGKSEVIGESPNQMTTALLRMRESAEVVQYNGFSATLDYPSGCTHINIHAIWPLSITNASTTFSVQTDQTSNANLLQSELMFADVENAERTMYPIQLDFQNQMARVTVNITGDISSKIATISLLNVYTSININPTNSALGNLTGSTGTIVVGASASVAAVLPPQTISSTNNFIQVLTTDNVTYVFKLGADRTLESGHNYVYNLVITATSDKERTISSALEVDETATAYFSCTRGVQQFAVPETGTYKLEAWGAKGGNSGQTQNAAITLGGAGGYTYGNFYLKEGTILYLVPGQKGYDQSNSDGGKGGYNGGGDSGDGYAFAGGGGGGGATHIALVPGVLADLSGQRDQILMVAGGGGGGSWTPGSNNRGYSNNGDGGEGGGETAGNGAKKGSNSNYNRNGSYLGASYGAGIDSDGNYYGYAFGIGQPGRNSYTTSGDGGEGGGGGGGGWYGGYSFNTGYYKILSWTSESDCLWRWVDEASLTDAEKEQGMTQWSLSTNNKNNTYTVGNIFYNSAQGPNTDTAGGGGSGYLNTSFSVNGNYYVANSGATVTAKRSGTTEALEIPSPTDPTVTINGNNGDGVVRITRVN